MFDFVRKHTKALMVVMFLLIIPSFVLVGIDSYTQMGSKAEAVARVGGQDITQPEWDNAHRIEVDRIRATRPNVDPKLLDSPQARYATLERMVRERVLAEAATQLKLSTGDARLARELQQNATIASLRGPDGKLDMERYRQLAASQGLTTEGLEARVRRDISAGQVETGITASGFATPKQADLSLNAFFEKREVQWLKFSPADFASKISPSDAELDAFYKANLTLFNAPETATVDYLVLDLEAVKKTVVINEAELKSYFEQNVSRLSGEQERRASHILINAPKDAAVAERDKARAKAQELLAQLRKAPDTFAEVAKKSSQDPGSAPAGGDLNYFVRGAMVKPFSDAAFAMTKGDISDVVESDFGFHIIRLTDIRDPKQKTFEELRPSIEADLKAQQAKVKYAEAAESFTNGVYEQADSLKPVADKLKLEIKTVTNLTRTPAADASGVMANPKILAAIFNADTIEKKRNTEAIEVGANQLVAAHVNQYTAARTLPYADVKASVREKVIAQRAIELAKAEGNQKLTVWKATPAAAELPVAVTIARDQPQNLPSQVLDAALHVDTAKLPVFSGVDLGAQGFAIVKVNAVTARATPAEPIAKQERAQYLQGWTGAENIAYFNGLKERFKVQIKVPKPAPIGLADGATSAR